MGLYQNNSGVLSPIAGRGKAEYGASAVRKGTFTIQMNITDSTYDLPITFSSPMPDADYIVDLDCHNQHGCVAVLYGTKTVNGFTVRASCVDPTAVGEQMMVTYTAFKLYTDNEYNGLLNNQRYSTDEIDTGKTWIDGKPIYRKVLQTTMPTVETDGTYATTTVAHGISGTKDLISLDATVHGYYQSGSLHYGYEANTAWGSTNDVKYSVYTQYNGENILIGSNRSTMNNMKVFIILEYTKTT